MERYFAFGANMHPATLQRRSVCVENPRPARLPDHRLVFDNPALPLLEPAFASVAPADDEVWGVAYEMRPEHLARLGGFEGNAYRDVEVEVEIDGAPVLARTYVTRGPGVTRRPSRRYLRVLIEAASVRGLPADWVARLERTPALYIPVVHELWGGVFRSIDHVRRFFVPPAGRH